MIPEVDRDFEWDQTKSDWNRLERGLPFGLAVLLFDRPTFERREIRWELPRITLPGDWHSRRTYPALRLYGQGFGAADYQPAAGEQERA
jgi:hypothetical protein